MGEIVFLSVFLVISAGLYYLTGSFRISKMDHSGGAALFPRIVIILLAVCILLRIIQILKQKEKKEFVWKSLFTRGRMEFVAALVVYVLCLKPVGYLISTALFLIFVVNRFYRIEYNGWGTARGVIVRNAALIAFTIAIYLVFHRLLGVSLPRGVFGR